jgi:hypothetical protein
MQSGEYDTEAIIEMFKKNEKERPIDRATNNRWISHMRLKKKKKKKN